MKARSQSISKVMDITEMPGIVVPDSFITLVLQRQQLSFVDGTNCLCLKSKVWMVRAGEPSACGAPPPFPPLAVLCTGLLPGTPWGRVWGGSWPESVCSGSPPARAPPGGSSEDWGWAGRSPGATGQRRASTALCCTCTGDHRRHMDQWARHALHCFSTAGVSGTTSSSRHQNWFSKNKIKLAHFLACLLNIDWLKLLNCIVRHQIQWGNTCMTHWKKETAYYLKVKKVNSQPEG